MSIEGSETTLGKTEVTPLITVKPREDGGTCLAETVPRLGVMAHKNVTKHVRGLDTLY